MILRLASVATITTLAAALAGCFNPKFADRIACGPAGECPPAQTCGTDQRCHGPGDLVADAPAGGGGTGVDAPRLDAPIDARPDATVDAPVDARPVGCQGDNDCATPPDKCSLAGTCNLGTHVCAYPAVVCTQLDGDCTVGACDPGSGACVANPRNENQSCGLGTTCGSFGVCQFGDTCTEVGSESRSCTVRTCHAGTCTSAGMTDVESCQRGSTDGTLCGSVSVTGCGACGGFETTCDEDGTESCTCVQPFCSGGTCSGQSPSGCTRGCTRDTDGESCGNKMVCDTGVCECPTC